MTQRLSLSRVTAFKLQRSHFKIRPREFIESPQFISQNKRIPSRKIKSMMLFSKFSVKIVTKATLGNEAQICFYIKRKQWIRSNHKSQPLKNVRTIPFHGNHLTILRTRGNRRNGSLSLPAEMKTGLTKRLEIEPNAF